MHPWPSLVQAEAAAGKTWDTGPEELCTGLLPRAWVPEGDSLQREASPTSAYRWRVLGGRTFLMAMRKELLYSLMFSLEAEKTLSSCETLHGTSNCFWEGGPIVSGVGAERHKNRTYYKKLADKA